MSNNKANPMDLEDKNQVVITPEDVAECAKFFKFFEIPTHPELTKALEAFQKDPTFFNQNELKFQLSEIITKSDHPVFADEVFAQVKPECAEVNENLAFERELEKQLTSTEE